MRSVGRKQVLAQRVSHAIHSHQLLQPWFNAIAAAPLLRLEAALRAPPSPHPAVAVAASQAHTLLVQVLASSPSLLLPLTSIVIQFLSRAFVIDSSVLVPSTSAAKRQRAAFLRSLPPAKCCAACNTLAPKTSGISSFFTASALKTCSVCLQSVCAACAAGSGWCGERACLRCVESLEASGVQASRKMNTKKPSLMASLFKAFRPVNAKPREEEEDWPRGYTVECGASQSVAAAGGGEAAERRELEVCKRVCQWVCEAQLIALHRMPSSNVVADCHLQEWMDDDEVCDDDRLCCSILMQPDLMVRLPVTTFTLFYMFTVLCGLRPLRFPG